jgi:hypothetical protein
MMGVTKELAIVFKKQNNRRIMEVNTMHTPTGQARYS